MFSLNFFIPYSFLNSLLLLVLLQNFIILSPQFFIVSSTILVFSLPSWMDGRTDGRLKEEGDYLSLFLFFRCTKNQIWFSGLRRVVRFVSGNWKQLEIPSFTTSFRPRRNVYWCRELKYAWQSLQNVPDMETPICLRCIIPCFAWCLMPSTRKPPRFSRKVLHLSELFFGEYLK